MNVSIVRTVNGKTVMTKMFSVTEHKPARIKATAGSNGFHITRSQHAKAYEGLRNSEMHAAIAKELIDKMDWGGKWVGGRDRENGYVFVREER